MWTTSRTGGLKHRGEPPSGTASDACMHAPRLDDGAKFSAYRSPDSLQE